MYIVLNHILLSLRSFGLVSFSLLGLGGLYSQGCIIVLNILILILSHKGYVQVVSTLKDVYSLKPSNIVGLVS